MLRYSATIVGLAICQVYDVDLVASLGLKTSVPFVGSVITGWLAAAPTLSMALSTAG